ncbi:MAG: hypothetical protein OQK66_02175, partial [Prosthecochloris sp.]|nr:hypothetical protein [Prosthecochloris sp.]
PPVSCLLVTRHSSPVTAPQALPRAKGANTSLVTRHASPRRRRAPPLPQSRSISYITTSELT